MNQKQIELRKAFLKLCLLEITCELWREDVQYLTNGETLINYKDGMEWFEDIVFLSKMINERYYLRNEVCDYYDGELCIAVRVETISWNCGTKKELSYTYLRKDGSLIGSVRAC